MKKFFGSGVKLDILWYDKIAFFRYDMTYTDMTHFIAPQPLITATTQLVSTTRYASG